MHNVIQVQDSRSRIGLAAGVWFSGHVGVVVFLLEEHVMKFLASLELAAYKVLLIIEFKFIDFERLDDR